MLRRFAVLGCLLAFYGLTGCVSSGTPADFKETDSAVVKEQNAINVVFNQVCKLMLSGDIKRVYDKYLSRIPREQQTYAEFSEEYESSKKLWLEIFNGAMLKHIAPEEKAASAVVLWGNGESSLIEFTREDGEWKINYLRTAPDVINSGAELQ
jgi:hypothetical protein